MGAIMFRQTGWFFLLLTLQVLVFNHIHILGYAMPVVYVYFLLIFPSNASRSLMLIAGFIAGLVFDSFANTPGMGAAAMTLMAFIQPSLLRIFGPREDDDEEYIPSRKTMGRWTYVAYLLTGSLIHNTIFFLLEAFSLFNWANVLINIGGGTLLATLIMLAIESVRGSFRRK